MKSPAWKHIHQPGPLEQPGPRSSHALAAIGSALYCMGGELQPRVPVPADLWRCDLETGGAWQRVPLTTAEQPSARIAPAAAAVGTSVYLFGGRSGVDMGEGALADLWRFDSATGAWEEVTPAAAGAATPPARSFHAMVAVGAHLYVFGGCGAAGTGRLNDLWRFDTATRTWTQLPSSSAVVGRGGAGLVATDTGGSGGGQLLVLSGFCGRELSDVHVFDLASETWRCPAGTAEGGADGAGGAAAPAHTCCGAPAAGARPSPRSMFGAGVHACGGGGGACAHDGHVLLFGGEVDPSASGHAGAGRFSSEAWCLEPSTLAWHALTPAPDAAAGAPAPRGWFASAAVPGGALAVHGGMDAANERLADLWLLEMA